MSAMPTSLHLSSLLKPNTKKQTHLCNVMGAIAFAYKPNPAAAQYLLMPVSDGLNVAYAGTMFCRQR